MESQEYDLMDAAEHQLWWYRALHRRLITALTDVAGRVLDAGCGTGGFLAGLATARPGLVLEGLEYNATAAARAAAKSGAVITQGSINALPYESNRFDAIISADVLCHEAVDPAQSLAELRRALRPGGVLVLNMPAYKWLISAHDRRVHNARRTTPSELRNWLNSAGFSHIQTEFWNSLLFPAMVLQRKVLARGESASDVATISPGLNNIFLSITQMEAHLPALPWGGSIIATARKPLAAPEPNP
jgi:SAM-dependent methyltransferase